MARVVEEARIQRALVDDEYVTKLLQMFESQSSVCMVFEHADMGDLARWVIQQGKKANDVAIKVISKQIIAGVKRLHERGIVHKDLKPMNVLLFSSQSSKYPRVKIADFGLSEKFQEGKKNSPSMMAGTAGFFAPELLKYQNFDEKIDIFSIGCIVYFMLTRNFLFQGETLEDVLVSNKTFTPDKLQDLNLSLS